MPGEFSQVGANVALDAVTLRAVPAAAGPTYLAMCSTAPTDTALGTELTTGGYARQELAWTAPAGDPSSTNVSTLETFGPFTADPPPATHAMLMDVATGGTVANMRTWWALDVAKDAATDESIEFPATTGIVLTAD